MQTVVSIVVVMNVIFCSVIIDTTLSVFLFRHSCEHFIVNLVSAIILTVRFIFMPFIITVIFAVALSYTINQLINQVYL